MDNFVYTTYKNSYIRISKMKSVVKNLLTKKTLGPDNFNIEFYQIQRTNNFNLT